MSVLRYFIIIGILAVGVYVFSCTSPTEAPSPESTETKVSQVKIHKRDLT